MKGQTKILNEFYDAEIGSSQQTNLYFIHFLESRVNQKDL
jgi:hypothetical protein